MNSVVKETLNYMQKCDSFHERCDCLLDHSECDYLLDYINQLENALNQVRKIVSKSVFKTDIVELCGMKNETKEILDKVGGSNE